MSTGPAGRRRVELRRPFTLETPVHVHLPAADADGSLLVALHGMGMSAGSFARHVLPLTPPASTLLLPQGPLPYEIRREGGIRQGNSWYVYLGDDDQFVESMGHTEAWLLDVVASCVESLDLDPRRVSLLGFSQGGYLAGFVGLRNAERFRRLVVAGGRIKHEVLLDAATAAASTSLRLLDVHGAEDGSVSLDAVRASAQAIADRGVPVRVETFPTGHAVLRHAPCQAIVREFLA